MRRITPNTASLGLLAVVLLAALNVAATPTALQEPRQQEGPGEPTGLRALAVKMGEEGLVAPVLVERATAEYTPAARRAGIEGDVYIEAVVTDAGVVVEPEIIRGIGDEGLDNAALAAITRWRFEPGTRDGEPVHVLALFTVTFRIR